MGIEINRLTTGSPSCHALSENSSTAAASPSLLRLHHLETDPEDTADSSTGETAGVYLGILNLFSTVPQFVGTFVSMLVFSILDPGKSKVLHKGTEGEGGDADAEKSAGLRDAPNAIAVCMFIGALSALGAAYATKRMKMASR